MDCSHSNRAVSLIQSCISILYFTDKGTSVWHCADLKVINYINIHLTQSTVCFLLRLILLHSFEKMLTTWQRSFCLDQLTSGFASHSHSVLPEKHTGPLFTLWTCNMETFFHTNMILCKKKKNNSPLSFY